MLDQAITDYTLIAISDMRAAGLAICTRLLNAAVMKTARLIVCLATLLLLPATPVLAQEVTKPAAAFDAAKGWASFVQLLHEKYGYFDRPGIDGDAILAAFADRAQAARTDKDFIDVLQLVSHNFADPHFVVGPLDTGDWSVIPHRIGPVRHPRRQGLPDR